jgi:hypothetical protein
MPLKILVLEKGVIKNGNGPKLLIFIANWGNFGLECKVYSLRALEWNPTRSGLIRSGEEWSH